MEMGGGKGREKSSKGKRGREGPLPSLPNPLLQDSRQDPPGIHVKKFRIAFRLIQGLARLIMTFLFTCRGDFALFPFA